MKNAFSLLLCCVFVSSLLVGCGKSAEEEKEERARVEKEKFDKLWAEQGRREEEAKKKLLR